jgi:hypothetical protein
MTQRASNELASAQPPPAWKALRGRHSHHSCICHHIRTDASHHTTDITAADCLLLQVLLMLSLMQQMRELVLTLS